MSTRELEILNQEETNYEFSSNLDGTRYYLQFDYNERNDTWHLTLKDADKNVLISAIPCLSNVKSMLTRFALDGVLGLGDIVIADTIDGKNDPSFENFGDTVSAFYTSILS